MLIYDMIVTAIILSPGLQCQTWFPIAMKGKGVGAKPMTYRGIGQVATMPLSFRIMIPTSDKSAH